MDTTKIVNSVEFKLTHEHFLQLIILGLYWGEHTERSLSTTAINILNNFMELKLLTPSEIQMLSGMMIVSNEFQKFLLRYIGFQSGRGLVANDFSYITCYGSNGCTAWKPYNLQSLLTRRMAISPKGKLKANEYEKHFEKFNLTKEHYLKCS